MTSHLSRSCSVRARSHPSWRLATAASSVLVGLGSSKPGRGGQAPPAPRFMPRLFVPPLPSWQSGGPSRGCLSPACSLQGSGSWGWTRTQVAGGNGQGSESPWSRPLSHPAAPRLEHGSSARGTVLLRVARSLVCLPTGRYRTHFEGRDPPVSSSVSPVPNNRLGTQQVKGNDL